MWRIDCDKFANWSFVPKIVESIPCTFIKNCVRKYFMKKILYRNDMPGCYNELRNINKELINGYNIRLKNYEEGVETMKTINCIIQRASRLRGKHFFCVEKSC